MMADLVVLGLVRAQLAASCAILIVLALRPAVRRLLGPELAYGAWALVPVAAATSFFPTLKDFLSKSGPGVTVHAPAVTWASPSLLLGVFAMGALVLVALFAFAEWRFRLMAQRGQAGPAVVGVSWPRIVLPSDYEDRFSAPERRLIRKHEQTHIRRKDPRDNLMIAAGQVLGWFNPLVHIAAHCAHLDQELACDAAVVEAMPEGRRLYAETLLKAHGIGPRSALTCALAGAGRHPLEVRLRFLRQAPLTVRQYVIGAAALGGLALTMAVGVWGLAPQTVKADRPTFEHFARYDYRP